MPYFIYDVHIVFAARRYWSILLARLSLLITSSLVKYIALSLALLHIRVFGAPRYWGILLVRLSLLIT